MLTVAEGPTVASAQERMVIWSVSWIDRWINLRLETR